MKEKKLLEKDISLLEEAVNTTTNDWKKDIERFTSRYFQFEKDSKKINKSDRNDYLQQANKLNEKFWGYVSV